jgi:hypothetical protein
MTVSTAFAHHGSTILSFKQDQETALTFEEKQDLLDEAVGVLNSPTIDSLTANLIDFAARRLDDDVVSGAIFVSGLATLLVQAAVWGLAVGRGLDPNVAAFTAEERANIAAAAAAQGITPAKFLTDLLTEVVASAGA